MRFLVLLWMALIFIVTCTNDVGLLLNELKVIFAPSSNPDWQNFSLFYPMDELSKFEMTGHFFMFLILTVLLISSTRVGVTIVITFSYAILTEILQLYFGRGAELYDVMANVVGIIVALCSVGLLKVLRGTKGKYLLEDNTL